MKPKGSITWEEQVAGSQLTVEWEFVESPISCLTVTIRLAGKTEGRWIGETERAELIPTHFKQTLSKLFFVNHDVPGEVVALWEQLEIKLLEAASQA